MKDKSLNAPTSPAPAEPEAPTSPATEEAPAINSVEAMLAGRFEAIESSLERNPEEPETPATSPEQPENPDMPEPETEQEPETPETDPEDPEHPEPEEQEDGEDQPEEDPEADIEGYDKVPKDVQERINRKFGKLTAQRKAAEEKIELQKAEIAALQEKATNSGMTAEEAQAVVRAGLPPEYLTKDEAETVRKEELYRNEMEWAFENLDGAEIGDKEYSSAQMRKYYLRVKREHEALQPQARRILEAKIQEYRDDLKVARDLRAKKQRISSVKPDTKKTEKPSNPAPSTPPPAASRRPPVSSPTRKPSSDLSALALSEEGVTTKTLQDAMESVF